MKIPTDEYFYLLDYADKNMSPKNIDDVNAEWARNRICRLEDKKELNFKICELKNSLMEIESNNTFALKRHLVSTLELLKEVNNVKTR